MGNSHIPFKDLVSVYILKIWRHLEEINVYDGKTLEFQKLKNINVFTLYPAIKCHRKKMCVFHVSAKSPE